MKRPSDFAGWRKNTPLYPDPSRPARYLATRVLQPGKQGIAPVLAIDVQCDDGSVRTIVTGGER